MRKIEEPAEQYPGSVLNLFLEKIKMSKNEFDNFVAMGPGHLQYDSPPFIEKITRIVFPGPDGT